jgi:glucose-1-phosphate thymidylyltransferase
MIHHMKGIILAGGNGSRLWPTTAAVSKQLLPVYNKPMIYYPLSTLMLAGVREVLLITTDEAVDSFRALLGDGSQLGINIEYRVQHAPRGIAEAVTIAADYFADGQALLILGDNIYHGAGMGRSLADEVQRGSGAKVFLHQVQDPRAYGVATLADDRITRIDEKPAVTTSPWAVTGLYRLDARAVDFAAQLTPSARGELEITDLLNRYADIGEVEGHQLTRATVWFDCGTSDGLLRAANYIESVESRQGLLIGSPEEVSVVRGLTSAQHQIERLSGQVADYAQKVVRSLQAPND